MKEVPRKDDPAVRSNLIDKAIEIVAPGLAVRRRHARYTLALTGGYTGGRRDRRQLRHFTPFAGSADGDILPDLPDLQARSRYLIRNEPIASGAIKTKVMNVPGSGLLPTPAIDREFLGLTEEQAAAWQAAAKREWQIAEKTLDITGKNDFPGMQSLGYRAMLESGDCFAVRQFKKRKGERYGTKYRLIEADRCSNPKGAQDTPGKLAGGIKFDSDGRPVTYCFTKGHPGDLSDRKNREWIEIPAYDDDGHPLVLHLSKQERIGQSRGVPDLAAVIEPFKQLERYAEAELQAAVISAAFTAFIKTENGEAVAPASGEAAGDNAGEYKMSSGMIYNLAKGEDIEFANPTRPNSNFEQFVLAVYKQIGVALGLPSDVLLKVFNSSYSASRAALDTAWQYFRTERKWLVKTLCQPVWESVIVEAVANGDLAAPGFFDNPLIRAAYCRAIWTGDGRIHIDPVKEANADKIYYDLGVTSLTDITRTRYGESWDEVNETRKREKAKLAADGMTPAPPPPAIPPEDPDPDRDPDNEQPEDEEGEDDGENGA